MLDTSLRLTVNQSLSEIDRDAWNALAAPEGLDYDPFLDWDFLEALERSGAATPEAGWTPLHLTAISDDDTLVAAMPLYAKTHSQGEFVFDHSWADAFYRAGGQYYPKLLGAVPFTPVTGRRFLLPQNDYADRLRTALVSGAIQLAEENGFSSLHINFADESEARMLEKIGLLHRTDQQFHFEDDNYGDFEGFLSALSSSKRKNLRKERAKAQSGLHFEHLSGSAITERHWDAFYAFYLDTGSRKWGSPYLNRETFRLIGKRMSDKIMLVMASRDGEPIAGALNFIGSKTLYGRYWGCIEHVPFLHFEVCYYQAIDYALKHGLKQVEAGAQGGHKLARGYRPMTTHSLHWIAHEGLRGAIADYLEREREAVAADLSYLETRTPFKNND